MKTLITICSAVGLIATLPLTAEANFDTCAGSLLDLPVHRSQARLQLSTWQVRRLGAIQRDAHSRRVRLQREIDRVQQQLDQLRRSPYDSMALRRLEQRQASLVRRLEHIMGRASSQAVMLLNPWQRRSCERRRPPRVAVLVDPEPPPLVVVRRPRPRVLKRVPRIRHAPPRHVYHKPPRDRRRPEKRVTVHRAPPAPDSPDAPPPRRRRHR